MLNDAFAHKMPMPNACLTPGCYIPSRIDKEINGFAWGLEVNNGGRETELLLYFGHAEVRNKRAGLVGDRWGGREKVYIPPAPAPNGHLNRR